VEAKPPPDAQRTDDIRVRDGAGITHRLMNRRDEVAPLPVIGKSAFDAVEIFHDCDRRDRT
jgi:hypothetical protein